MKKNVSVMVLFALLIIGLAFVPQVKAQQCSTFDFFTNTLHIPCFNLNNAAYWVDMGFVHSTLQVKAFAVIGSASSDPDCASFDFATNLFHIPCASVKDGNYWIDLFLTNTAPSYEFTIQSYNYVNAAPGYPE